MRELRYAWRGLSKRPLIFGLTVGSLALGIGTCTAVFTLVDTIILRAIHVSRPDRLVQIATADPQGRAGYVGFAARDAVDRTEIFDGTCAFLTPGVTATVERDIRPIAALALSGQCFDVLGIRAAAGRLLEPSDDVRGAPNVAVLSYRIWQQEFGGAPDAIGRTVTLEGERFTIVGVAEDRFEGLQVGFPARLMIPLGPQAFLPAALRGLALSANVFARLRDDVSLEQADARLQSLWPQILEDTVETDLPPAQRAAYMAARVSVTSAATGLDSTVRSRFRIPLLALMGIAAVVLTVSTLNAATLLLARGLERRREHAIRAALGAGRWQLLRGTAIESGMVLGAAAAFGAVLAVASVRLLTSLYAATSRNFGLDVAPDTRIVLFFSAVTFAGWAGAALLPLLTLRHVEPAITLTSGAFGNTGRPGSGRRALLVVQVAFTVALVACAVGFATTIAALRDVPLGYEADGLVNARLAPLPGGARQPGPPVYQAELLDRLRAVPGVQAVAVTGQSTLFAFVPRSRVGVAGQQDQPIDAQMLQVSEGFFETLQLPLIAGTSLSRADGRLEGPTAVVSRAVAERLFGGTDATGRHIQVGTATQPVRIVGVAADATLGNPRAPLEPTIYLNFWEQPPSFLEYPVFVIRSGLPVAAISAAVRQELAPGGRFYPLAIQPIAANLDGALLQERLLSITSAMFAGVGLLLAAIGLFGLASVTAARRTKEFGIRLAVGASPRQVLGLIMRDTLMSVVLGIAAGLPLIWAADRLLAGLFYERSVSSVTAIAATVALMVLTGLVAAWMPARRATKIDPLRALRAD
jgi:predicted permease